MLHAFLFRRRGFRGNSAHLNCFLKRILTDASLSVRLCLSVLTRFALPKAALSLCLCCIILKTLSSEQCMYPLICQMSFIMPFSCTAKRRRGGARGSFKRGRWSAGAPLCGARAQLRLQTIWLFALQSANLSPSRSCIRARASAFSCPHPPPGVRPVVGLCFATAGWSPAFTPTGVRPPSRSPALFRSCRVCVLF